MLGSGIKWLKRNRRKCSELWDGKICNFDDAMGEDEAAVVLQKLHQEKFKFGYRYVLSNRSRPTTVNVVLDEFLE